MSYIEDKYTISQRVKSEIAWILLIVFVLLLPGIIADVFIMAREHRDITVRLTLMGKESVVVYPNFMMECRGEHGWSANFANPQTGVRETNNYCVYDFSPPLHMEYKKGDESAK